jgi:uncharacterized protein (DUF58 family)
MSEPLVTSDDIHTLERLTLNSLEALLSGIGGRSGGPGRTSGFEFADYRRYNPGDDIRQIDWNVYARLHELYVRTPPQESRLALALLVDASASMEFGVPSKLRYAERVAALLGIVALLRTDTVQVHSLHDGITVSGGIHDASRAIVPLISELTDLQIGRTTDLAQSVRRARDYGADAELAVLVSDALTPREQLDEALRELARNARSAALVHIVDPGDATAGPTGAYVLVDRETGQRVERSITDETQLRYAELYSELQEQVERSCRAAGVRYVSAPTTVDALTLLLESGRSEELVLPASA